MRKAIVITGARSGLGALRSSWSPSARATGSRASGNKELFRDPRVGARVARALGFSPGEPAPDRACACVRACVLFPSPGDTRALKPRDARALPVRFALLALAMLAAPLALGQHASEPPLPVVFAPGADARALDLVVANDRGSFTATLRAVAGAELRASDAVRIANVDDVTHGVTLRAPHVDGADRYQLAFGDAALDLAARDPTVTIALAPGETRAGALVLAVPEGAASVGTATVTVAVS